MGLKSSKEFLDFDIQDITEKLTRIESEEKTLKERIEFIEKENMSTKELSIELKSKEEKLDKLASEKDKLELENNLLRENLESAEIKYDELHTQIIEGKLDEEAYDSMISMPAIEEQIRIWLDDPNINVVLIPDKIEMYIYKKTLGSFLSGLEKIFKTISLELLGHHIKIVMRPNRRS